jgi:hypothetical protein
VVCDAIVTRQQHFADDSVLSRVELSEAGEMVYGG